MRTSVEKSPGWLRGIQIGLGIITVILSIYALAFPASSYISGSNSDTCNYFVYRGN